MEIQLTDIQNHFFVLTKAFLNLKIIGCKKDYFKIFMFDLYNFCMNLNIRISLKEKRLLVEETHLSSRQVKIKDIPFLK